MDRPKVVGGAPFAWGSDHYAEMLKASAGFGRTQVWDFNSLWVDRWNQRGLADHHILPQHTDAEVCQWTGRRLWRHGTCAEGTPCSL